MKTKQIVLLLVFACFAFQACSEKPLTAEDIVNKNIEARGGEKLLGDIKSIQAEIELMIMGMNVPLKISSVLPDKYRTDLNMMGQDLVTIVNGDEGWMIQGGEVMDLPPDQIENAKLQVDNQLLGSLSHSLIGYKEKGITLELLGEEEVEGVMTFKVKVTNADETSLVNYYDKNTFLEVKTISEDNMMGQVVKLEIIYKDNKKFDGIMMPQLVEMYSEGQKQLTMEFKSIKINGNIDDSLFQKP